MIFTKNGVRYSLMPYGRLYRWSESAEWWVLAITDVETSGLLPL